MQSSYIQLDRPVGRDHATGTTESPPDDERAAGLSTRAIKMAVFMAALLLALVLLLTGLFIWQAQRDARVAVETRASSAAFTASAYARWLIEANLQASRRLAESVSRRPDFFRSLDPAIFAEEAAAIPDQSVVVLYGTDGKPLFASVRELSAPDIASEAYFASLANGADWIIGPFVRGVLAEGEAIPIARRVERGGRFAGAVVILVPVRLLAQFWQSMEIGPGSTVGLLRTDGWMIARYPTPEKPINLANYVLFTEYLPRSPDGVYPQDVSPADGLARIVGYRKVEGLPLVTVVGVPATMLDGGIWQRATEIAVVALPIWLALLGLSVLTVRLLHREERARLDLAGALERNRMLLREIHHRVKNNLQTVTSLIQLQPGEAPAKRELMDRIAAMTAVHEHIYQSDSFDYVDIANYIRTLVEQLRQSHGAGVSVDCSLDSVVVGADQALPVGLIVNEVVTNAFKHAFPEGRPGTIRVAIGSDRPGEVRVTVQDDGVGYGMGRGGGPSGGMGSRLIRGLTRQVRGHYEFRNDHGTLFILIFPVTGHGAASVSAGRPVSVVHS